MPTIFTSNGLRRFREKRPDKALLKLLAKFGGAILISWMIGVGKSTALDNLVEAATRSGDYDLVVVLVPTKAVMAERRWVKNPPAGIKVTVLRARPGESCGRKLNKQWELFEDKSLGMLGRKRLCQQECAHYATCFWPSQYGKSLEGSLVIYATQAHLERDPLFIEALKVWAGAQRVLVLLDEANFLAKNLRRRISKKDLKRFRRVLKKLRRDQTLQAWIQLLDLALSAGNHKLRAPGWVLPELSPAHAIQIQQSGYDTYGTEFRYIAYEFRLFGFSPWDSREKLEDGSLAFSIQPAFDSNLIVFSGTVDPEFAGYRLGRALAAPFAEYLFIHEGTRWYNLASRTGMKKYFLSHEAQLLDFFAGLVANRLAEGKRVLLISKKVYVRRCRIGMEHRLYERGMVDARVLEHPLSPEDLADPLVVPIINYGMVGINDFEQFDCAYCLNSFYVNERVLDYVLQDRLASDNKIPLRITTSKTSPPRRTAGAADPAHSDTEVHRLAPLALRQQEMDVVLQAVGRVRPYTQPREVITFQLAEHPHIPYTREFLNLEQAREFFGVPSRLQRKKATTAARVREAKEAGLSQRQVAKELGLSLRTVKRHWNQRKGVS